MSGRADRRGRWPGVIPGVAGVLAVLLLVGCRHSMAPPELPQAASASFSASGSAAVPEQWWRAFGDPALDEAITRCFENNFSLGEVWARLVQAEAIAKRSGAALRPSVDGSADVSRSVRDAEDTPRTTSSLYSAALMARYEVDLWGRLAAGRDAAALDAAASREDLATAAMTLAAETARVWFRLAEQRGQLSVLEAQRATNGRYLEVITLRFRRGQAPATDVLQQRQLLEEIHGQRSLVEATAASLEHQLAVLIGRAPTERVEPSPVRLPALPALPQTGVPVEWLRRRPDIRAAEYRVHAADQRVAAALADRFPRLKLSLVSEGSALHAADVFSTWLASVAAGLSVPLADGGQRRAEIDRTRGVLAERLQSYGQIVLDSMREVEDALSHEQHERDYLASLRQQLELAEQATAQTLDRYSKGTMDFTRYLSAVLAQQRLERSALQAERDLLLNRIVLYRALAGSWQPVGRLQDAVPRRSDKDHETATQADGERS